MTSSMDKMPLGIRRDLRDAWESPQSPAREAVANLSELLGLEVRIELEAPMLWAELQKYFPDKDAFVPSIIGVVKAWVECLILKLADDANTTWTDKLLEHVNRSGRHLLRARVETVKNSRPKTTLGVTSFDFIIALPESLPPYRNASHSFESDFQTMFDKDGPGNDNEWTNVPTSMPAREQYEQGNQGRVSEMLPSLDALPRPERLFESQLPYQLLVRLLHNGIVVQSSHQPSLELLAGYLTKYTKSMKNVHPKIPDMNIELQDSKYGLGLLFDSLSISSSDNRSTYLQNPVLILAFVEGVLGYHIVTQSCSENQWYFRRDVKLTS